MASGHVTASKGRTHGCTDQCCKREESSCQLGAVHTWHIATFRCDSPPWSLLEGIADMNGRVASAKNVEIDPERKLNAPRSGMVTPASPR